MYNSIKNGQSAPDGWTFPEKYDKCSVSATIGSSKVENDPVVMSCNVAQAVAAFGRYISFKLFDNDKPAVEASNSEIANDKMACTGESDNAKVNAFEILMSSGRKLSLPTPQAEDTQKQNNKIRLYNKVLQLLEKAGLGFTQQNMDNGINFIQCITNSLWYIDPFLDKMYDMSCHLPMLFEHFSGYNDPNRHDFHICSFLCIKLLLIL